MNDLAPTNCTSQFDKHIYAIVAAVAAVAACISLLACFFVIFIIILFKKWRFFTQRLILYLAITAALKASATILQRVDYENQSSTPYRNFCVAAGFYSQVTAWMVLMAVLTITLALLVTSFSSKPLCKYEPFFLFMIFLFPLTFNWIPFIQSSYGKSGPWCWIRSNTGCNTLRFGLALQFILWYVPLYSIMIVLLILYIMVLCKLKQARRKWTGSYNPHTQQLKEVANSKIIPLLSFPLIFFILNIPIFINRVNELANRDPSVPLWFISSALFPFEGGAIAVAFSLDPQTRQRLTVANIKASFRDFTRSHDVVSDYPIEEVGTEARLEEVLLQGRRDNIAKAATI